MLAPLNDLIAANGVDTSDYVDSLYNEGVRDGVSYWLPMARSTPLFYYNKEAFSEVGLDTAPENWADLLAVAGELVQKDGDTVTRSAFAHPNSASYIAWLFQDVIWRYKGSYSDPDFTIRINEPNGVEAGEFYHSSVVDGWATTPADPVTDLATSLTASIMASTGSLRGLTETIGDKFPFGTAFLPEARTFGCCTGGAGLAVLTGPRRRSRKLPSRSSSSPPQPRQQPSGRRTRVTCRSASQRQPARRCRPSSRKTRISRRPSIN